MKKIMYVLFVSSILINACRKPKEAPSLTSVITQGEWYVNLMKDKGANNTAFYKGWKFIFQPDKVVKVTDGVNNYTGVWDEDILRQKFILTIASPEIELIYISQEWDISFKTPKRVTFRDNDLNPTQELQFTKF